MADKRRAKREMAAKQAKVVERVNHPEHYNGIDIECIDVIEQMGNVPLAIAMKYIWRVDEVLGGGNRPEEENARDIESAIWYLCRHLGYVPDTRID